MNIRSIAAATMLAALVTTTAACGSDTSSTASPATTAKSSGASTTLGTGSSDAPLTTEAGTSGGKYIPGLGNLDNCAQLGAAYAGLGASVMTGGSAGAKQAQQAVAALKDKFPSLAADLDVVSKTFGDIASKGIVTAAQEMDTAEFKKANESVVNSIAASCGVSTTIGG